MPSAKAASGAASPRVNRWSHTASSTLPLEIRLRANDRDVAVTLAPNETRAVDVPLAPGTTDVENTIRGDRRLVLLETAFQ